MLVWHRFCFLFYVLLFENFINRHEITTFYFFSLFFCHIFFLFYLYIYCHFLSLLYLSTFSLLSYHFISPLTLFTFRHYFEDVLKRKNEKRQAGINDLNAATLKLMVKLIEFVNWSIKTISWQSWYWAKKKKKEEIILFKLDTLSKEFISSKKPAPACLSQQESKCKKS